MEDVIFSGTSNRPSKNISNVSILLDNKANEGPSQYNNSEEVLVKRKIERDKGSKYYINNKEVRARDVQTLFADLSTGAHSPSLISQGRIGQLVTAKPIESLNTWREDPRKLPSSSAALVSGKHAAQVGFKSSAQEPGRTQQPGSSSRRASSKAGRWMASSASWLCTPVRCSV